MREIKITIDKRDGTTKVETEGFVGRACMDATEQLQRALGVTTQDDTTPEFEVKEVRQVGN